MREETSRHPQVSSANESLQVLLSSLNLLSNPVNCIALSPCSKYLAVPRKTVNLEDCLILIRSSNWRSDRKPEIRAKWICSSAVCSLVFLQNSLTSDSSMTISSPVNRRYDFTKNLFLIAGLENGKINIWNVDTLELTLVLLDHRSMVSGLALARSSMQLASCSHDKTIKLWNLLDDGNMYHTLDEWSDQVNRVKWSPNERYLCAVGAHGMVILYQRNPWQKRFHFQSHWNHVVDCSFSSDSALLATASFDTRVLLWSTRTGEQLREYLHKVPKPLRIYAGGSNDSFVRSVRFSKFNEYLISICDDRKLRFSSVQSHQTQILQPGKHLVSLTMSSNGEILVTGSNTGEIHLYSSVIDRFPSLKHLCRMFINNENWNRRKNIDDLPLSRSLISYLLYRPDYVK